MNIFGAVRSWNNARKTRDQLNSLTNRQLDDIGIARYGIDAVARNRIKG